MADRTQRIRELNDQFRTTLTGGKVYMTAGVDALPDEAKRQALEHVKTFDRFTRDNDPWNEHDFGSFEIAGQKLFFKIDYYDKRRPRPRIGRSERRGRDGTHAHADAGQTNTSLHATAALLTRGRLLV